jgi:nitroreductase
MTPLEQAARLALHAPSVFNTQPWTWHIDGKTMQLYADQTRHLDATDPDGRLLLLSCGAALHHARIALAAAGWTADVTHLPDPAVPALLARIRLGAPCPPDPAAERLAAAITRRRTDRRAFGDREVPAPVLDELRRLVEAEGTYLHVVRPDQVPVLAMAAEVAGRPGDPGHQAELRRWTSRPETAGDGVPPATAVQVSPRRVPLRDFVPDGEAGLDPGEGHDKGATYVVLFGLTDRRTDLLRAGEALSALLLAATADGLATAAMSDVVEASWPKHLLRVLLSGIGEPYVAVRLGYPTAPSLAPPAPRRAPADAIIVH